MIVWKAQEAYPNLYGHTENGGGDDFINVDAQIRQLQNQGEFLSIFNLS